MYSFKAPHVHSLKAPHTYSFEATHTLGCPMCMNSFKAPHIYEQFQGPSLALYPGGRVSMRQTGHSLATPAPTSDGAGGAWWGVLGRTAQGQGVVRRAAQPQGILGVAWGGGGSDVLGCVAGVAAVGVAAISPAPSALTDAAPAVPLVVECSEGHDIEEEEGGAHGQGDAQLGRIVPARLDQHRRGLPETSGTFRTAILAAFLGAGPGIAH